MLENGGQFSRYRLYMLYFLLYTFFPTSPGEGSLFSVASLSVTTCPPDPEYLLYLLDWKSLWALDHPAVTVQ